MAGRAFEFWLSPASTTLTGLSYLQNQPELHRRHLHVLKLHRAVFQHRLYHGIFTHAARKNIFRQLIQNHALQYPLQRPRPKPRVGAGFAQVIEHFGGGFELDAHAAAGTIF